MKSKELFPAVFSRHAAAYHGRIEDVMERGEAPGRLRVIQRLDARPGMRLLDLACGPGTLTRRLAPLVAPGGEVVGVDLAPGMIAVAREAGIANARFEVMDIERLSFPDASFDGAACGHGIQFVPDLPLALAETRRVLRPGSRFAASVPVESDLESVWSVLNSVVDRWLPPAPRVVDQGLTRETVANALAFERAAIDAGFETAEVEVVEETVTWESAERLISLFSSWWSCALRLDAIDAGAREAFTVEATKTLRRAYPGPIETTGRSHVLLAVA